MKFFIFKFCHTHIHSHRCAAKVRLPSSLQAVNLNLSLRKKAICSKSRQASSKYVCKQVAYELKFVDVVDRNSNSSLLISTHLFDTGLRVVVDDLGDIFIAVLFVVGQLGLACR